ncbi:MAG: DUF485 domain-containing protein [Candidatus Delongbacteria bacterium]|nr:DUF485 domain-containing protein [Candidatus Delongbacteria bacterium]MBN2834464.1 DUF485 domain-containing protein [Candidatus Delongbacteria bacterium]
MDHGPAVKLGKDNASDFKAKLGIKLFIFYSLVYVGFVALTIFSPELMNSRIVFGLNLAVAYGFGLIVLAIIMGVIYNSICTRAENKMNTNVEVEK